MTQKVIRVKPSALLLLSLLAPAVAFADTPNFKYDYLEAGHLNVSPQSDQNGKGNYVDLSYSIFDGVQLVGSYARLNYDSTPGSPTAKDYTFGFAGESNLMDGTDAYTYVLYVNDQVDNQSVTTTENGYRLEVGLRRALTNWAELDGFLAHDYVKTADNEIGLGVMFDPMPWLAVGLSYAHNNAYTNTTTLRLRWYF